MTRACADTSGNFPTSHGAIHMLKEADLSNAATLQEEVCNDTEPCRNEGTCSGGVCRCSSDYTGTRCETPAWCSWGRCGYEDDVTCVWDNFLKKGECRCKENNYHYLPKDRKCKKCDCGGRGSCRVVDNRLVCECNKGSALNSSTCAPCDCGSMGDRCSYTPRGEKLCQCPKGFAPKTPRWSKYATWCEVCDCGNHGKCRFDDSEKICDCEDGYREVRRKCRECNCGEHGTCDFDRSGYKVCTCDYGYAEQNGFCQVCDCNYLQSKRTLGVNCTFILELKHCICPSGFKTFSEYCEDIDECYPTSPCSSNALCINKPGTFECKCKDGFRPTHPSLDSKFSECEDIDECYELPCSSPFTRCVNSPGSFDCVCKDGYYPTSGTYGRSYKPEYNACYEIETQWREATIALGVILSVAIIWISCYIKKHKSSS